MDKIGKIKLSMAKLGWNIEERISDDGWGDSIGYRIWFKRWEWHGKETLTLIGNKVCFTGATSDAFDYEAVLNIVYKTAKKQEKLGMIFLAMYHVQILVEKSCLKDCLSLGNVEEMWTGKTKEILLYGRKDYIFGCRWCT